MGNKHGCGVRTAAPIIYLEGLSEDVSVLTAFPADAPGQVKAKELCNKHKIAFVAETGATAQMWWWWNQSGRSKAAKIKETR
jgi:hypothetical protein